MYRTTATTIRMYKRWRSKDGSEEDHTDLRRNMFYYGYEIKREKTYYRVTDLSDPVRCTWTEDSVLDAKATINELLDEEEL